jgi:hypothetical protein
MTARTIRAPAALRRDTRFQACSPGAKWVRPLAVYFIQAGVGGPIKIGCSADAASRLATLQVGNPEALRLLATAPGGFAEEATLHARFAAHRLTGEWFRPTLELLAFIAGGAL